ncbi:hypothetical protein [Spirosoma montaniterrae]|uniref:Outer membrane protein beta-barrel domain-containing protein n=1 Tax=Spirosoma montaniterrae TaxID=1178516 RepID=A0A1P9WVB9_9BACT|nr:hypothetical protein [Spirosoma montaniterrae]AQG79335.1 hypothetical protein AWR27_08375 [Spirosoma montaniterrae]
MKLIRYGLLLAGLYAAAVQAQPSALQIRIQRLGSLRYNNVNDLGWNGWALQVEKSHSAPNGLGWLAGAEMGYTGWGSQVLAKGGVQYQLTKSSRWLSSVRAYVMPGAALFRPRPLFTYRVGGEVVGAYKLGKRFGLMAAAGIAYAACPAYDRYGSINRYVDVPLSVGVLFTASQTAR